MLRYIFPDSALQCAPSTLILDIALVLDTSTAGMSADQYNAASLRSDVLVVKEAGLGK